MATRRKALPLCLELIAVSSISTSANGQYLIPVEQLYEVIGIDKKVVVDGNIGYVFFSGIDHNNIDIPAMTEFVKARY